MSKQPSICSTTLTVYKKFVNNLDDNIKILFNSWPREKQQKFMKNVALINESALIAKASLPPTLNPMSDHRLADVELETGLRIYKEDVLNDKSCDGPFIHQENMVNLLNTIFSAVEYPKMVSTAATFFSENIIAEFLTFA